MPAWDYILDNILNGAQWICFGILVYYYLLSYLGMGKPRPVPPSAPKTRFAVLIPAHNEERVLPLLLETLQNQEYPSDLLEVYVVADNCHDGTARVARLAGATVLERVSPLRGKGYALQFGLREVLARSRCDVVCIMDADNLAHPRLLSIVNSYFAQGAQVVQARVETKNPLDSWVSASYAINFWLSHRLWQLARARAGLSGLLCGTGMCFRADLLREMGWPATSLTEDLEYTMLLISRGLKVTWAHEALVFDEKPTRFWPSCRQRLRWLQGKWQVLFAYGPRLFWSALREGSWLKADGFLCLLQPPLLLLGPLCALAALAHPRPLAPAPISLAHRSHPELILLGLLPYFLPAVAMYLEKAPARAYLYLPAYTFFSFTWIPIALAGLIMYRQRRWYRTPHTRAITLEQRARLYSLPQARS